MDAEAVRMLAEAAKFEFEFKERDPEAGEDLMAVGNKLVIQLSKTGWDLSSYTYTLNAK